MDETITAAGVTFKRPLLAAETSASGAQDTLNNEIWKTPDIAVATQMCADQLPDDTQLQALFDAGGIISHGWPTAPGFYYWSETEEAGGSSRGFDMSLGKAGTLAADGEQLVSCL